MTSDVATTPRKPLTPTQRLKLFERHKGICVLCKQQIREGEPWIDEHLIPLGLGGDNSPANRAPAHKKCADIKTHGKNGDLAKIAKAKRSKMKALGIKKEDAPKIENRGFAKVEKIKKEPLAMLPRRPMFVDK